ncbi:MAG: NAD(P)/FAD-dependent oxidoreductase [Bryobacteraceae bacterium]
MPANSKSEAIVVGSGPNGLTAAIELARAGFDTTIVEAQPAIGGGIHSAELTLPGFIHDVCSAIHPLAVSSPAFAQYPLAQHGLRWIHPPVPMAHPLDGGKAALLQRSLDETAEDLGGETRYRQIAAPMVREWVRLSSAFLRPMLPPRHLLTMAKFGIHAAQPATWQARRIFSSLEGRALFAGLAAHSALPLAWPPSSAFGWVLGIAAHAVGWPLPEGGSQAIARSLASYFESLGGSIVTGERVQSLKETSEAKLVLFDVGPREFLSIAGDALPSTYRRSLEQFRPGPAAFKVDWALSGPVPWTNPDCGRAGTVHLGGTLEEVTASESAAWRGAAHPRPFVLFVQPSLFDSTRAPAGAHTGWAYCHVLNGSREDMTSRIEAQVERFAPGFAKLILARHVTTPSDFERLNPNYTGGDILGGAQTPLQLLFRPTRHLYKTPLRGVYLCSASTPPGGGVHGMCGYWAARMAIADAASFMQRD